ncbi:Uncharacterized short protein YbdD, DUF466 family [Actinobaculum suis]|uniref:Uncharacterized short protein YbdD, DUF466 family n=1 Tax=Actinobaculum suis TaxID=1657 RepID=A0A1G7AJC1_9ACTO|nr:YbdD/YjiX family protein [Actinobaculum suis]MDY5152563.1 YbdD/YjiX family protein [Actinobaculum suis]SDE13966.1 Uncharacterized short protein YbdD, DUF466 family [Actinobaculum suis]
MAERSADRAGYLKAAWRRLRAQLAYAGQLWRAFTGEAAYDRYVERHQRHHPDCPPLTAKEFWRQRAEWNEHNVQSGCC